MNMEWWLDFVQRAGGVAAVLELGALVWMNVDRNRLLRSLGTKDAVIAEKDKKLSDLSERSLVVWTEVKTFLFHGGRHT